MLPQVLVLSQNPRIRKVYHSSLHETACEVLTVPSVADGLAQIAIGRIDLIIFDDSLPIFEVLLMLEVLQKKPSWSAITLVGVGFVANGHALTKTVRLFARLEESISLVQGLYRIV